MNSKYLLLVSLTFIYYFFCVNRYVSLLKYFLFFLGMALGLGETDKTTAKQILRRRQLPLKDFEQKTGVFEIDYVL